jgi:hypothetical protein
MRTGMKSREDLEIRLQLEFLVAKGNIDRELSRAYFEEAVVEPDGAVAASQVVD